MFHKVFHGAEWDIEWLQRDLSIYVVNMFDTHQASRILCYPKLSLAYLLMRFHGIEADKSLATADWRRRPLRYDLIQYARQDTHFLLSIYDSMRQELLRLDSGGPINLLEVYQRSVEVCKRRYVKSKLQPTTYLEVYKKSGYAFDACQLNVLRELVAWRDRIARKKDEGCGYVLPNRSLFEIVKRLPRTEMGILACCEPIPPLVQQYASDLLNIVRNETQTPAKNEVY